MDNFCYNLLSGGESLLHESTTLFHHHWPSIPTIRYRGGGRGQWRSLFSHTKSITMLHKTNTYSSKQTWYTTPGPLSSHLSLALSPLSMSPITELRRPKTLWNPQSPLHHLYLTTKKLRKSSQRIMHLYLTTCRYFLIQKKDASYYDILILPFSILFFLVKMKLSFQ